MRGVRRRAVARRIKRHQRRSVGFLSAIRLLCGLPVRA